MHYNITMLKRQCFPVSSSIDFSCALLAVTRHHKEVFVEISERDSGATGHYHGETWHIPCFAVMI